MDTAFSKMYTEDQPIAWSVVHSNSYLIVDVRIRIKPTEQLEGYLFHLWSAFPVNTQFRLNVVTTPKQRRVLTGLDQSYQWISGTKSETTKPGTPVHDNI